MIGYLCKVFEANRLQVKSSFYEVYNVAEFTQLWPNWGKGVTFRFYRVQDSGCARAIS